MLPQIGATELILIAVLALIVVGPKDLPLMMRRLGQFLARMRNMAQEFRASFDELATQTELDELRQQVAAMREGRYLDELADPEVEQVFDEINADLHGRPKPPPGPALEAPGEEAGAPEPAPKPKPKPKKKAAAKTAPAKKAPAAKPAKPRARKTPEPKP